MGQRKQYQPKTLYQISLFVATEVKRERSRTRKESHIARKKIRGRLLSTLAIYMLGFLPNNPSWWTFYINEIIMGMTQTSAWWEVFLQSWGLPKYLSTVMSLPESHTGTTMQQAHLAVLGSWGRETVMDQGRTFHTATLRQISPDSFSPNEGLLKLVKCTCLQCLFEYNQKYRQRMDKTMHLWF